jgi:hypothetical protein
MSGETIANALFLITAVICAGVLIMAIYPSIYMMAGTFSSSSHTADQNIRTDFKIVLATYSSTTGNVTVYMKNVGTAQIPLNGSYVICADSGKLGGVPLYYVLSSGQWTTGEWTAILCPASSNSQCSPLPNNPNWPNWDPGETLMVTALSSSVTGTDNIYFQFVLPTGIHRELTFMPPGPGE